MEVGVLTVPLADRPLSHALSYLADLGVDAVELGCGGYPGSAHLDPDEYLDDDGRQTSLQNELDDRDLVVSALATHNNPLHPDTSRAEEADEELRSAIRLASQLDVGTVTCFSGLPAGSSEDTTPNWVTAPWPSEHAQALKYQWDVAIDYWGEIATLASEHDVDIAIEMHPNMLVYEPHGLVRLRNATNDRVGANLDPSHLYWQQIDPVAAIRWLGNRDAIHHVHAKDTELYDTEVQTKGVLDTVSYDDPEHRSWLFRTVGYGHGENHWKQVVSALRIVGYDGAVSIEHEDALTSPREGLEKAVELLERVVFETEPGDTYWAES